MTGNNVFAISHGGISAGPLCQDFIKLVGDFISYEMQNPNEATLKGFNRAPPRW